MLTKKRSRYRKKKAAYILTGCAVLIVAAVFGAGIWKKQTASPHLKKSENSVSMDQQEDGITYKGKTYTYNDHLSNFLFMGIDTRGEVENQETDNTGQADAIFLVSMDRVTEQIHVISIPRDTITEIEVFTVGGKSLGKMENHINLQFAQGDGKRESCELMEDAVSDLFGGIHIQSYCAVNMDAIPVMTEIAGNVEVTVPDNSLAEVNPEFTEGVEVVLTKDNVEQFVRYRDIDQTQSALVRQNRQKSFLQAYMKKAQEEYQKDASFVTRLYDSLRSYMVTNMGNDIFVKFLTATEKNPPVTHTVPGEGVQGDYYDEFHVDQDGLQDLIYSVFYKEDK